MTYLLRSVLLVTSLLLVAGCGSSTTGNTNTSNNGGSGGGSDGGDGGVAGPLDVVQTTLSSSVVAPLQDGVAGTPLEAVVGCVDEAVVTDLVDVVDAIALGLESGAGGADPAAALEAAAGNIQTALLGFGEGAVALIESLAGGPGCQGGGDDDGDNGGDTGGDTGGEDVDLAQVSELLTTITGQINDAFQNVPAEVATAPIAGGVVQLLDDALTDLDLLLTEVGDYNGPAASAATDTLLANLLDNLLLDVLPVRAGEEATGSGPVVSGPVSDGIGQLTNALSGGLEPVLEGVLNTVLDDAGSPVLDPVENDVLGAILTPLLDAINGGGSGGGSGGPTGTPLDALFDALGGIGGGGSGDGPTGTPLDDLIGLLTGLGEGFGSGDGGPTGTPLDLILGPLLGAIPAP